MKLKKILVILTLAAIFQANAVGAASSKDEDFAYVRIFSASVDGGLDKSLDELEVIARAYGTEEVAMFLPSDGPEEQAKRWTLRAGLEEYSYPGVTVKARTYLRRQKQAKALQMSKDGRKATGLLARENARVQWALPESVSVPLMCDIYEDGKLIATNTIHERLSPSGNKRWPDVIRIDVPERDCSIIQCFDYLDERPSELSSIQRGFDFSKKRPSDNSTAEEIVTLEKYSGDAEPYAMDSGEVEKRGPVLFSDCWLTGLPSLDVDTGWKPGGSPLQIRFEAGAGAVIASSIWGEFVLSYTDINSGDANLTLPNNDSGGGILGMDFGVEMSTRGRINVDLKLKEFDFTFNIPYAPNFDLRCKDSNWFDSYLLSNSTPSSVKVSDSIDTQELFSKSLGGIKGIADVSVGVYADMEAWVEMSADDLSTNSGGEYREFTSEGQTLEVTPASGGTYTADVDYDEDLDVGITVTFFPALCAEIDTYIYQWDYCVSAFKLPVNIDLGSIDLDLSSTLLFEKTYDLMIIDNVGGTTIPGPGIYSSDEPNTQYVEVNGIELNYDFDHWFDHWVSSDGTGGDNTIVDFNCTVTMDDNTPWHTLYPAFFYATAANPFPADGADRIGRDTILSWRPGEHADLHRVYFGTSFDDVSNRIEDVNRGLWGSAQYDTNDYDANLGRCQTYYWRIDEVNDGYSGAGSPPWLSNVVWRFVTAGCRASDPMPADGHNDAPTRGLLRWRPGACVIDVGGHDVYFGTDYAAVESADMNSVEYMGNYDQSSFDTDDYNPNGLTIGTTYYWRVDEVNDGYPYVGPPNRPNWKGDVWSFTVGHIPVDNFEDYSNKGELIAVWQDPDATESDIYLETDTDYVQEGIQSMRYLYDNVSGYWKYSVVAADTVDLRCGSDWTEQGVEALVLYFYGDPNNDAEERMWVGLEDSGLKAGFVECEADTNDANEWNVDLNDPHFSLVDMTNVAKVYIGFGLRGSTMPPGGTGEVWFDEIRLYPPRCRAGCSRPAGDITGDCLVDYEDLSVVVRDWLLGDYSVGAIEPVDANLIVEYTFDEGDLGDTSGPPTYDGWDVNSVYLHDGILTLSGSNFVEIPFGGDNLFDSPNDFSISLWFKTNRSGVLMSSARDNNPANHSMAVFAEDWGDESGAVIYGNFWLGTVSAGGNPLDNEWHHIAVTCDYDPDVNTAVHHVYLDSVPGTEDSWDPNIPTVEDDVVRIGGSRNPEFPQAETAGNFVGDINSVRIYNYTLSPEEVCYLFNGELPIPCYQPLKSPAELYKEELQGSRKVNFKDYSILANNWLEEILWP